MSNKGCLICGFKGWSYIHYTEGCWGIVEQHGFCDRCGYTIEQSYSPTIAGFELDRQKGYKIKGVWHGKNTRKRKRMRRKHNIKHNPKDWMLAYI